MLTIEEQIERIADHAFEQASAPERPPRRWPALAAAAVVLLAAGSLMWAAVRREATDEADIGASDQDRLAALMADAVEFPVSAADPPEWPSAALSFREPGTVRAVTTPSGMTVFRESGVTAVPGYGAFEARCVGFDGRTSGCELPNASGLPWIPDPARIGVSVWVDVPIEVDVVVIIDGDNRLWQRPVSQLAVWPPPTDPDWSVEAFDATGRSIARIDQSTIEERDASVSSNDEPDETASSMAELSNFRDCLVAAGATFDRDATLPQFVDGTNASALWDSCVASTFEDGSTSSTTPASDVGELTLPTDLPGDWRVFAVSRTSSIVSPSADQVFGRSEQNGVTGLRVVVTSNEFLGVGEGAEQIDLRGRPAGIVRDAEGWHVQWGEAGVMVEVTSRGIDRELLLAALEQFEFRAEPITGFDPTSAPADLPLLIEAVTDETTPQIMTGLRLKQGDALPTPAEATGTDPFGAIGTIFISDRSGLFGSAPQILFQGERRGDLVVARDPGENDLHAVLADGTIVVIRLPDGVGSEVADVILDGLAPQPASAILALQDEASARLAQLPEVRVAAIDDRHTLRLRGDAADAPLAMCLDVDGVERCRLTLLASPIGDPASINGVVIAGRWYVFGFEPADQDPLTIAPWRAGETLDPLPSTDVISDGVRSWFAEIPTDVDDVRILDLPAAQGQQTTFRRPDR